MKFYFIPLLVGNLCFSACNARQNAAKQQPGNLASTQKQNTMDLSKISDETVRQAISALQNGDKAWYTYFTENPVMTDDGNTIDFKGFFSKALGTEHFLTIDKVENEGMDIYGSFKAGQWGTFKVFFKFHKNESGKFDRLDIGQANY
ncbi:MAG: hypothetical protein JNM21_12585 [Taibaiella sp.]|nr:hypothetical protein [Taibaiella sp.]